MRQFWFSQLLPLLASALEYGSASALALTALLKMGSALSAEEFCVKVYNNFNTFMMPLFFVLSYCLILSLTRTHLIPVLDFTILYLGASNPC